MYGRAKKRIEEWRKKLPPFDRAIQELQALEASQLNNQEEYKQYYSSLTAYCSKLSGRGSKCQCP